MRMAKIMATTSRFPPLLTLNVGDAMAAQGVRWVSQRVTLGDSCNGGAATRGILLKWWPQAVDAHTAQEL